LPRGRQLCGWLPRALRWSTQERPSRATMSNTSLTRASFKEIRRPRLLETSYMLEQFRLFDLEDALGEGWLKRR
jgi:hypothetical protein